MTGQPAMMAVFLVFMTLAYCQGFMAGRLSDRSFLGLFASYVLGMAIGGVIVLYLNSH